jgi:hypothetical protein
MRYFYQDQVVGETSLPSLRPLASLKKCIATSGLQQGPNSLGRQQWGILDNGLTLDPAMLNERIEGNEP